MDSNPSVPHSRLIPLLRLFVLALFLSSVTPWSVAQATASLGVFETHADVGATPMKGKATFDAASREYRITGGGANVWAKKDAFHFVWKRIDGNFTLTADVRFEGKGAEEHRKAMLMVRQSLDPGSAYADVALHGDGLTALQFRPEPDAETSEVRSTLNAPTRISIERRGAQFYMSVGKAGGNPVSATPATVELKGAVYVGLAVCSHDANVLETAVFSNVSLQELPASVPNPNPTHVKSEITVFDLESKSSKVIFSDNKLWEAPNWSPDGKYLIANSGGIVYRFDVTGEKAKPQPLALDKSYNCNNDKAISPDGKRFAFSAEHGGAPDSQVYVAKADGSSPQLMTPNMPSYFHGWSPDGKWLAFVAERGGNFDIYRVATIGGEEQRLTSSPGFDDGPDYSPDGKWIFINSNRTDGWDIWRFPADGAGPDDSKVERITAGRDEDWFPHPSPDGKWIVYLSFPAGTRNHDVKTAIKLQMIPMPPSDGAAHPVEPDDEVAKELVQIFGGQGTINVNSWAPDSKKFAFVSYEVLP